MCLPDFIEFKQIEESNPLIGYRLWENLIDKDNLDLKSEHRDYIWKPIEGPHEILEKNSGIYSYNYNYNYYNYNYYNNNYNYYNNNDNNYNYNNCYYNNYYYNGIILQWGKVAIHKKGYRSEFAKIKTIFTIREVDARGSQHFLDWIKQFNEKINYISLKYKCNTIHWQDFIEQ